MEQRTKKFLWMKVTEIMRKNPPILTPRQKLRSFWID